MSVLYVTSKEKGSGVTSVCAALGTLLLKKGKKVGYLKPSPSGNPDGDAVFVKSVLSLEEPADALAPAASPEAVPSGLGSAVSAVSAGKDVVIIEGAPEYYGKSAEIAKELNARLLVVEPYSEYISQAVVAYKGFGQPMLGVIFNKAPGNRISEVKKETSEQLKKVGITCLGTIQEDRALYSLTIGELAQAVSGEMLRGKDRSDELVENFMLGAMTVDSGPRYFGRKDNKAAILRSERSDMQLSAMSTSTRCLVLTGKTEPLEVVKIEAEERDVPIITTPESTVAVMEKIENALTETGMKQAGKLARFTNLVAENIDLDTLYKELGL